MVLEKHQKLTHLDLYEKGFFEIQDLNSQKVADFCLPKPGMFVIDACAGAGGKTLHLAALMQNRGRILALDPYQKKLEQLEIRLKRNGVRIAEIVNEASIILSSSDPVESKIIKLNDIAERSVDIDGIGMYTLGKIRKNISFIFSGIFN